VIAPNQKSVYEQPKLGYGYGDLAPFLSEEQLKIHYEKHHAAYVKAANELLGKLDAARADGSELDMKSTLKSLTFNVGGHVLHSAFWENLAPAGKGGGTPGGKLGDALIAEFGGFERFKKEFTQAAVSTEGSGWAALTFCGCTKRPAIMQIEKHNSNLYPMAPVILILDVFEHAYYLDYKNERGKYVEAFWNAVNWKAAEERFLDLIK